MTQIALGLSSGLAIILGDTWLSPVWLARGQQHGIRGFGLLVFVAELAALVMVVRGPRPGGLSLTRALAIATVVVLPLNFLAALVGSGYDRRTDGLAVAFLIFYVLQIALVPLSWRARRKEHAGG